MITIALCLVGDYHCTVGGMSGGCLLLYYVWWVLTVALLVGCLVGDYRCTMVGDYRCTVGGTSGG